MSQIRLKPLSRKKFQEIYSQVTRLTVEVIVKQAGAVVLARRQEKSWQGQWHIPGGTVLYKEGLKVAVQRIAKEELGIKVKNAKLIGYIEYPSEEKERGFGWSIGIVFLCEPASEIDQQRWQREKIQFFTEIPENIVVEQREILAKVLTSE